MRPNGTVKYQLRLHFALVPGSAWAADPVRASVKNVVRPRGATDYAKPVREILNRIGLGWDRTLARRPGESGPVAQRRSPRSVKRLVADRGSCRRGKERFKQGDDPKQIVSL
jgi:hypothetical protein